MHWIGVYPLDKSHQLFVQLGPEVQSGLTSTLLLAITGNGNAPVKCNQPPGHMGGGGGGGGGGD